MLDLKAFSTETDCSDPVESQSVTSSQIVAAINDSSLSGDKRQCSSRKRLRRKRRKRHPSARGRKSKRKRMSKRLRRLIWYRKRMKKTQKIHYSESNRIWSRENFEQRVNEVDHQSHSNIVNDENQPLNGTHITPEMISVLERRQDSERDPNCMVYFLLLFRERNVLFDFDRQNISCSPIQHKTLSNWINAASSYFCVTKQHLSRNRKNVELPVTSRIFKFIFMYSPQIKFK